MATISFDVKGLPEVDKIHERFNKEVKRKVDLASKRGINKSLDLMLYGKTKGVTVTSVKDESVVGLTSRLLKIPKYHVFYRTFARNVKVSTGRGGAKPYASGMIRTNSINYANLLVSKTDAKSAYGYKSRRKRVGTKRKVNLDSAVNRARGGKRSGTVKIGTRVFENTYIENGKLRGSSAYWDKFYQKSLGAQKFKLSNIGNPYFLFQRKYGKGQRKPYPVKAVRMAQRTVGRAVNSAMTRTLSRRADDVAQVQTLEVNQELKKLGFALK